MKKSLLLFLIILISLFLLTFSIQAESKILKKATHLSELFKNLKIRNIGPAIMGGRLSDVEGIPGNYKVYYIASASGGLWKTENGGISWIPIFDKQKLLSIGDFALAPSNPDIIYVGTGEDNPRNSSSFGNGIYKSTDGGKTWKYLGLKGTERISRIIVHPKNPDIVYVAAIGPVFGAGKERGVFMSTDGGKTWKKILYIDEYHGASDLEMDPANPKILYAGMWYFQRKLWKFTSGDEKGGVFRSVDGGKTWKKIEKPFPKIMGRVGVKVAPSNPNIVYVLAETKDYVLYKSEDRGTTFKPVNKNFELVNRGFYYTELRVDPVDENRVYAVSSRLWLSEDGGKTFKRIGKNIHVDFHTMWIDPKNPYHILVGNDGGLDISYDRGKTFEFVNNLVISQFYHVSIDERDPFYYVCGGLQDNGSWCGPSTTKYSRGVPNDFWYKIGGGDGFYVVSNKNLKNVYLSEFQAGGISRVNLNTAEELFISPYPRRNDGGPVSKLKYRFNWNSPIIKSHFDENRVYFAGNVLFRSDDFGLSWIRISPDLTTDNKEREKGGGGPLYNENTTAEYYCTITAFSESPLDEKILWVGSDDGLVHYTLDGGKNWVNVTNNIKGLEKDSYVSFIETSNFSKSTVYISFDRHMENDFSPYIFKTENSGKSWKKISSNLPLGAYVHVIKEDPSNKNILFVGTEIGLFVSWNGGKYWEKINFANFPNVPVYDMKIYKKDLVLATHGRGIWIFDNISPIEEISSVYKTKKLYIFPPKDALLYKRYSLREFMGDKDFTGENVPAGAIFYYYLNSKTQQKYTMKIFDENGDLVRKEKVNLKPGINKIIWDLRYDPAKPRRKGGKVIRSWFGGTMGPSVLPGKYKIELTGNNIVAEKNFIVKVDPTVKYSKSDHQKQIKLALKLREQISQLNLKLRKLDNIENQLKSLKKTILNGFDNPDKQLFQKIDSMLRETVDLKKGIARYSNNYWMEGNKILEDLMNLYSAIQRSFRAPSSAVLKVYREELVPEYNGIMKNIDTFFEEKVPAFNKWLRTKKLDGIVL